MARQNQSARSASRSAAHRGLGSQQSARLSFEKDLREAGFGPEEIQAAWSRTDEVGRVSIELMALAAGLASEEDLASETVKRARNTLANVVEMPFEEFERLAFKLWSQWEERSGRSLAERPLDAFGAGVMLQVEDCEARLGWSQYPPGNIGMAARIIVRREIYDAIERRYPRLGDECHRQFRAEWDRLLSMKRARRG